MKKKMCGLIAAVLLVSACGNNAAPAATTTEAATTEAAATMAATEAVTKATTAETTKPKTTTTTTSATTSATTTTPEETSEAPAAAPASSFTGTVDGITLTVSDWKIDKDDLGKDIVLLTIDFRNDSEKEASYVLSVTDVIMQDGIECSGTPFTSKADSAAILSKVLPGYSNTFVRAYCIDDTAKPIVFKYSKFIKNDPFFEFTLDPATSEATATTSAPATTSLEANEISVTLKSYRLAKDYSGEDFLLVTYTFCHNRDEATAFAYAVLDKAYQNGVECSGIVISDDLDTGTQLNKIMPGVEYDVQVGYPLKDTTSDVTLKLENMYKIFSDSVILETTISLS